MSVNLTRAWHLRKWRGHGRFQAVTIYINVYDLWVMYHLFIPQSKGNDKQKKIHKVLVPGSSVHLSSSDSQNLNARPFRDSSTSHYRSSSHFEKLSDDQWSWAWKLAQAHPWWAVCVQGPSTHSQSPGRSMQSGTCGRLVCWCSEHSGQGV